MGPIHVQNVNIANIVTVIIQHSIVANVVQMNLYYHKATVNELIEHFKV